MGEKYDDCGYEYGPDRPLLRLSRVLDPSGPGFPPAEFGMMRTWGDEGRAAFRRYDERRDADVRQMCADATQQLTGAGTDENAQLGAGRDVVQRLDTGQHELELHAAQSQMTLQMLDREGTIPPTELVDEARASARRMKKSVSEHVGPLEALVGDLFATARSSALNAAGAQIEEAVNRIGQSAYTSTAGLYQAIRRRGLIEPDPGSTA
jgi:hypothetical protein